MSIHNDQYDLIYEEFKDVVEDAIRDFIINNYPAVDVEDAVSYCVKMINEYGVE